MKILFIHDYDFRHTTGGAELNLKYTWDNAPEGLELKFMENRNFIRRKIRGFDKIIIGNIRTLSSDKVKMIVRILKEEKIPYVKSEHDVMWSDDRACKELKFTTSSVECEVIGDATKNEWYLPTKELFENAEIARFLSPAQKLLFSAVGIENDNSFIAGSYVDKSIFKTFIDWDKRPYEAFCKFGHLWGETAGKEKAKEDGLEITVLGHRGMDAVGMADFFNSYKYFYDFPVLRTTYGRAILEAYLCGVELRIDPTHAIYSFGSIDKAVENSQTAIKDFWDGILR